MLPALLSKRRTCLHDQPRILKSRQRTTTNNHDHVLATMNENVQLSWCQIRKRRCRIPIRYLAGSAAVRSSSTTTDGHRSLIQRKQTRGGIMMHLLISPTTRLVLRQVVVLGWCSYMHGARLYTTSTRALRNLYWQF